MTLIPEWLVGWVGRVMCRLFRAHNVTCRGRKDHVIRRGEIDMGYLSMQIHETDTPTRPRVVVLCGSTRFKADFERVNRNLTLGGHIVVAPGVFGHADGIELSEASKTALDALHLRKIDLADEVIVVNPGGYIGDSTRNEIAYAELTGKPISYLERPSVAPMRSGRD